MNRQLLHEKLIRAARHNPPASQVPYAFEKRVMAHLGPPVRDEWTAIARALCWSAGACCAIAMGISIWAFAFDEARESAATFSSELEQTILASIDDFKSEPDFDLMEGELEILQ
jgi:hypothetical protein